MQREYTRGWTRRAVATAILFSLCAWAPHRAMAQQAEQSLAGTTWRLVSLTMSGQTVTPDDGMKYTLSFDKKGMVAVHADCNRGKGPYKDPMGEIDIGPITLTRAHCAAGSIADQFARAIGFAQSFTMNDNNLMLGMSPTGDTLRLERTATRGK